jgi:hypothetical protein
MIEKINKLEEEISNLKQEEERKKEKLKILTTEKANRIRELFVKYLKEFSVFLSNNLGQNFNSSGEVDEYEIDFHKGTIKISSGNIGLRWGEDGLECVSKVGDFNNSLIEIAPKFINNFKEIRREFLIISLKQENKRLTQKVKDRQIKLERKQSYRSSILENEKNEIDRLKKRKQKRIILGNKAKTDDFFQNHIKFSNS